jgi:hypothetical protein
MVVLVNEESAPLRIGMGNLVERLAQPERSESC